MIRCSRCQAEVPGASFRCLECFAEGSPIARERVQMEITIADSAASSRVELALGLLCGSAPEVVAAVVDSLQFGLVAELAPEERDRMLSALAHTGVRFRQSTTSLAPGRRAIRFAFDVNFAAKVVTVMALAVATSFMGFPLVSWLGVAVALVLCWSVIDRVPNVIQIPRILVEEKLAGVDRVVWNELAVERRSIKGPEAQAAASGCLWALCALIGQIRSDGWHLARTDFSSLDHDAHALLRRSVRLAAAADRVAQACDQAGISSPRLTKLATARREMFAALRAIEQKLEALQSSLVELAGLQATQVGLSAITTRVTEIQEAVERGLEMSELAVEDSNRLSHVRG
jgi:hypothetical protein